MTFATLTHSKITSWEQLSAAHGHNEREIDVPNADGSRDVEELLEEDGSAPMHYADRARDILAAYDVSPKLRKNGVLATEDIYGASPEYWGDWRSRRDEIRDDPLIREIIAHAKELHGDRLVSVSLHLDEATPHVHVIALPLVRKFHSVRGRRPKDGVERPAVEKWSLSARDLRGGPRYALEKAHDAWADRVAYLGLKRGSRGSAMTPEERKQRQLGRTKRTSLYLAEQRRQAEQANNDAISLRLKVKGERIDVELVRQEIVRERGDIEIQRQLLAVDRAYTEALMQSAQEREEKAKKAEQAALDEQARVAAARAAAQQALRRAEEIEKAVMAEKAKVTAAAQKVAIDQAATAAARKVAEERHAAVAAEKGALNDLRIKTAADQVASATARQQAELDQKAAADVRRLASAEQAAAAADRDAAAKEKAAAAAALSAARVDQIKAAAARAAANNAQIENEGVSIALDLWATGKLKPKRQGQPGDWEWKDKATEASWSEKVRAGGIRAWEAVKMASQAILEAIKARVTPEIVERYLATLVTPSDIAAFLAEKTEKQALERLQQLMAKASAKAPTPEPVLAPHMRRLIAERSRQGR